MRDVGLALLTDGHDAATPLAIVDDTTLATVGPIFERVCSHFAVELPSEHEAARVVATAILSDISAGDVQPEAGLAQLMRDVYDPYLAGKRAAGPDHYVGEALGLQHLIGAYYGYDDLRERPTELSIEGRFGEDAIPLLNEEVISYARDWLENHGHG